MGNARQAAGLVPPTATCTYSSLAARFRRGSWTYSTLFRARACFVHRLTSQRTPAARAFDPSTRQTKTARELETQKQPQQEQQQQRLPVSGEQQWNQHKK